MDFPALVYKNNGPHSRAGGTYDHKVVKDAAEFSVAVGEGWYRSLPEAIAGVSDSSVDAIEDEAPVTRIELEAKAKELGIKFTKKTPDDDLSMLITTALAVALATSEEVAPE